MRLRPLPKRLLRWLGACSYRFMRAFTVALGLIVAGVILGGCDGSKTLDSIKSTLDSVGTRIDNSLGVAPAARYDRLGDDDVAFAAQAMQTALETRKDGQTLAWNNPESGNGGSITPMRTYLTDAGVYCREYREVVEIQGDIGEATNTGCRTGERSWAWVD